MLSDHKIYFIYYNIYIGICMLAVAGEFFCFGITIIALVQLLQALLLIANCILGTVAAVKEYTDLLKTYMETLGVVLFLQIFITLLISIKITNTRIELDDDLRRTMKHDKEKMDLYQEKFRCCGLNGPGDYEVLPESCNIFKEGCLEVMSIVWDLAMLSNFVLSLVAYAVMGFGIALAYVVRQEMINANEE